MQWGKVKTEKASTSAFTYNKKDGFKRSESVSSPQTPQKGDLRGEEFESRSTFGDSRQSRAPRVNLVIAKPLCQSEERSPESR